MPHNDDNAEQLPILLNPINICKINRLNYFPPFNKITITKLCQLYPTFANLFGMIRAKNTHHFSENGIEREQFS